MFAAEVFTGNTGKYVTLQDNINSFKAIINGEVDDLPEAAFYMVGNLDDVKEKAARLR